MHLHSKSAFHHTAFLPEAFSFNDIGVLIIKLEEILCTMVRNKLDMISFAGSSDQFRCLSPVDAKKETNK